MEQGAVAAAEPHHGVVDGGIPVGVELHGSAHHVGALGALAPQELHLVHGIQQLPVTGLEAVDLWDSSADDDAHGVGHIVDLQGLGDGLFQHLRMESFDVWVVRFGTIRFGFLLVCHSFSFSPIPTK